jgi:hypothetical protein
MFFVSNPNGIGEPPCPAGIEPSLAAAIFLNGDAENAHDNCVRQQP